MPVTSSDYGIVEQSGKAWGLRGRSEIGDVVRGPEGGPARDAEHDVPVGGGEELAGNHRGEACILARNTGTQLFRGIARPGRRLRPAMGSTR
jgi:hypothetical protein